MFLSLPIEAHKEFVKTSHGCIYSELLFHGRYFLWIWFLFYSNHLGVA